MSKRKNKRNKAKSNVYNKKTSRRKKASIKNKNRKVQSTQTKSNVSSTKENNARSKKENNARSKKECNEQSMSSRGKRIRRVLAACLCVVTVLSGAIYIYAADLMNNIKQEKAEDIKLQPESFDNDIQYSLFSKDDLDAVEKELDWSDYGYDTSSMDGVTNILLCGEENLAEKGTGARGRTDCMMIATIDNKHKSLKLTNLMRDTYVEIPGYSNNKLNASYAIGGMPLLSETIENNFGIKIDGYIHIDLAGFEKVIDILGGVEIELSKEEADYLNSTNYISKKKYRNVKEGKQLMNGNQALGYARVRYVKTPDGLADDYGRNYRQRTVLNQLYEKYKDAKVSTILNILPEVLKYVTTNIDKENLIYYAANVLTMGTTEIETYRVPVDGYYKNARVNTMLVLYITDINKTRETLYEYIFGEKPKSSNNLENYYSSSSTEESNTNNEQTDVKNEDTNSNKKVDTTVAESKESKSKESKESKSKDTKSKESKTESKSKEGKSKDTKSKESKTESKSKEGKSKDTKSKDTKTESKQTDRKEAETKEKHDKKDKDTKEAETESSTNEDGEQTEINEYDNLE